MEGMSLLTDPTAPRYQQIKDFILERMRSGEWSAEHRVPSENELVKLTGHSRVTVGRALRELADAGLLKRVQGVGTFVAGGPPQSALLELRDIAEDIAGRGHVHTAIVQALDSRTADEALALAFGVAPGSLLFHSRLVHCEDGVPVQLEDRLVNPLIAPAYLRQDFRRTTPYAHLMAAAPAERVEHVVEATRADAATAAALDIDPTEPCLLIHRRTWSRRMVATRAWLFHPGSRFRLGGAF
ncbi:histidine utilization repressor [Roseomonas sp. 573]|uniref:Histidine utilization repressor n=2 Tax=Roseomonas haemaphysalidis TaxID=2768162 RepID=A0ABS3KSD5_9PROT|nr:histidine utilization repressor [Roseomonas haemaphysalidis]